MPEHRPRAFAGARADLLALALLACSLAGCSNVDRVVATSPVPDDFHQRHPVVLADARQTLDIFLVGRSDHLDYRQTRDLAAFAADYRAHGEGLVLVQLPRGGGMNRAVDATLEAVRRGLAANGVTGDIAVGAYLVADPSLAAPLRLSFVKLQARAASRCGDWPEDLGSGSTLRTWENRTYYNFGCANRQTLAAQIDDPRDLVRPRAEDPADVQMRTRAIGDLRGNPVLIGQDPSTNWGTQTTPTGRIGAVGTAVLQ